MQIFSLARAVRFVPLRVVPVCAAAASGFIYPMLALAGLIATVVYVGSKAAEPEK